MGFQEVNSTKILIQKTAVTHKEFGANFRGGGAPVIFLLNGSFTKVLTKFCERATLKNTFQIIYFCLLFSVLYILSTICFKLFPDGQGTCLTKIWAGAKLEQPNLWHLKKFRLLVSKQSLGCSFCLQSRVILNDLRSQKN